MLVFGQRLEGGLALLGVSPSPGSDQRVRLAAERAWETRRFPLNLVHFMHPTSRNGITTGRGVRCTPPRFPGIKDFGLSNDRVFAAGFQEIGPPEALSSASPGGLLRQPLSLRPGK